MSKFFSLILVVFDYLFYNKNQEIFNEVKQIMLKLLLGDPNTRKLKRYQPIVEEINLLEAEVSKLTDEQLRSETINLKSKHLNHKAKTV